MLKYVVRRLLAAIPVLFGLSIVVFAFVHLLPGDPVAALLGQHATPELREEIRTRMGLDKPLYEQYFIYLNQLVHLDLGKSVINNRPVLEELGRRFPATVELTAAALLFAIGLGIPLGRLAARFPQRWPDAVVTVVSLLGISIPIFVLGYTLQFFFAASLQWLPASGRINPRLGLDVVTNLMLVDTLLSGKLDWFADALLHLILPAIALGSIPLAIITRITRAAVLDVSNEDYVRTARAKGLSENRIMWLHVLRNASIPIITNLMAALPGLLLGAFLIERFFSIPGIGREVILAVERSDFPVFKALTVYVAFATIASNLLADLMYKAVDPRVQLK